ncbi:hypothetical protein M3J09_011235 [Ascochyta lentis]
MSAEIAPTFVCHVPRCRLKTFKRRAELTRHELTHANKRHFPCLAQDCKYAFTRKDKRVDHMRAGHDKETLFVCPTPNCLAVLTQDTLPLHVQQLAYTQKHRSCPIPRCKLGLIVGPQSSLDLLQDHLKNDHDARGRAKFVGLLLDRGYDHTSLQVICPVCPDNGGFDHHADFYRHFLIYHIPKDASCPLCPGKGAMSPEEVEIHYQHQKYDVEQHTTKALPTMAQGYGNGIACKALRSCEVVPEEVRKHCRTVLSLWPDFEDHPVWSDIKGC